MKVVGSATLGVERKRLWEAFHDPEVLVRTIPGCERLQEVGTDVYSMTLTAGVASIKGVYQGQVALVDPQEPERFVLKAQGQGAPGTVEATVQVLLSEVEGGTRVDYDADAVVGGMIGGVGQRMLSSVAKRMANEFFTAVERHLLSGGAAAAGQQAPEQAVPEQAAPEAAAAEPAAAPRETAKVFTREAGGPARPAGAPSWSLVTAFGLGAAVALGSAVVGWLLGRSRRR